MVTTARTETDMVRGETQQLRNSSEGIGKSPMPSPSGSSQQLMVIRESGAIMFPPDTADKLLDASLGLLGAFFVIVLVERRLRRWLHE